MKSYHFLFLSLLLFLLVPDALCLAQEQSEQGPAVSPYQGAALYDKRQIEIDFDDMDIYPVLDHVLGSVLGLNFVVEPVIKGTVSLHIKGEYSKLELLDIMNSVLELHGLSITKGEHGLFKVVRKGNAARLGATVKEGIARFSGDYIRVYQLEYLSASNAASSLKNFVSSGALVVPVQSSNSVLICDSQENLKKIEEILEILDGKVFDDLHWRLFSLENTSVEDVSKDLDRIFRNNPLYKRPGIDPNGLQIIPLETLNAVLVITRWEKMLNEVGRWIEELDQGQLDKGTQVYVYFVQHGRAVDLAQLLNELYGDAGSKDKKILVQRKDKKGKKETRATITSTGELSGEVKIIADEVNNSLIFKAKPKDYQIIKEVLKKLDVIPRQVLIDVLIAEVSLSNEVQYGVEWFIKGLDAFGQKAGNARLDRGLGAALENGLRGFTYTLWGGDDTLRALIHLLDEATDVDILSAPNIVATDNQEARIEIGEDVPVLSESIVSTGGVTTQGVQYRKTGIILQVKPYINDNGLVRMEVTQEVSQVNDQQTSGITSPRITNRKATTYLIAEDGQHILIGGLMSTKTQETHTGIPVLKDIPILGYLFGSKGQKVEKKELIFILTPHVIKSREHADRLTKEFALKVHSLKKMLEENKILEKKKRKSQQQDDADLDEIY
jgi:general secretion pathway protein D